MNLSKKEEKYLLKLEKYVERIYLAYISVGLSLCAGIVGLVVGIILDRKGGFLMAIISFGIAINIFLLSHSYQNLFNIISKMKQYIAELERK